MQEKRAFRRVPLVAKIELQAGGFPFIALADNISVGGMLIHTANAVPEGRVVHLKFTLPGAGNEIAVTGTVQHVNQEAYIGVRFTDLKPSEQEAIQRFVESA